MNEWPAPALTLAGVWCSCARSSRAGRAAVAHRARRRRLLCGLAAGLKLTFGTFAVALCVALWLRSATPWRALLRGFREASCRRRGTRRHADLRRRVDVGAVVDVRTRSSPTATCG